MADEYRPSESGWPQDRPSGEGQSNWGHTPQQPAGYPYGTGDPRYQGSPYGNPNPYGYQQPGPGYGADSGYGYQQQGGYPGQPGQGQAGYPYGQPTQGFPAGGYGYPYPQAPYEKKKRSVGSIVAIGALLLAIPVAAGIGIGQAFQHSNNTASAGTSSSGNGVSTSGDSASVAAEVDPGLVDINTTLGYANEEAAGTGMVLTSTGEILTNNHVINGATSISVTDIGNGKTYKATVVGYDRTDDVAVLQLVNASGLKTVTLGNSSTVKVGDAVVAIGNAGGTGGTPSVAAGSVSELNQSITASDESDGTSEQLTGLIQTDANVQPGDSGGPLVTTDGHVIGMDTAASTSGGNFQMQGQSSTTGEGFAIPINSAISIAKQIEAKTTTSKIHIGETAFLGVAPQTTSTNNNSGGGYGQGYGNGYGNGNGSSGSGTSSGGVVIGEVVPGAPAQEAGLTSGDTIVSVDGTAVNDANSLTDLIGAHHPGDKITVVWTDTSGASHTSTITLANGPSD